MSPPPSPPRGRPGGPGGGLRVFGCLWRVASDDLVLPAWIEFAFRCLGLSVAAGVLVFEEVTENSCASEYHLGVYLAVAVGLFSLTGANLLLLALESAKGSIWDPDPNARWKVVPLVYVNIVMTVLEFLWALVGSVWVIRGLMAECVRPGMITTNVPVYAVLFVVMVTWIFLVMKVLVSLVSFNTMDCSRDKQVTNNNETLIADPRPSLKSRLFSLCMKKTQISMFSDVANVLSEIFDDHSFVPTDVAAALILLYARDVEPTVRIHASTLSGDREEDQTNQERIAKDDVPRHIGSGDSGRRIEEEGWDHPSIVAHFMAYAGAAYGYTWYLMRNTAVNLWRMYPHLHCCACCCTCVQEEGLVIEADNCLQCNTAALRAMLPHLDGDSLVHISFRNKMAQVPYFVAVDHELRKIVVSIRGTLSLEDTLTDLCATPESMGSFHDSLSGHVVHSGMFQAAKYVYDELRSKNILNKTFSYYDDYELVVTGHSLGAGTAVILTFMLRQFYPSAKCYAYSPPGGLLNEAAAVQSRDFALSVIVGKDLVCRLSLHSIARFKENMKQVLLACRLPKYQILSSGLSACCVSDWRATLDDSSLYLNPRSSNSRERICSESEASIGSGEPILGQKNNNQAEEEIEGGGGDAAAVQREETAILIESSRSTVAPISSVDVENLQLPGKIWHVVGSVLRGDSSSSTGELDLTVTTRTSQDFQEILVSPKMLTDHFPSNVYDVLQALADAKTSIVRN